MKVGKNKATVEYHAAQQAVTDAMRRVRQANDELADANSELKDATKRLREFERGTAYISS